MINHPSCLIMLIPIYDSNKHVHFQYVHDIVLEIDIRFTYFLLHYLYDAVSKLKKTKERMTYNIGQVKRV